MRVGWVLRVLTALECQVKGGCWERQGSGAEGLSCGRDGTFQNKHSVSLNADLETEQSCQLPRSGGTMQLGLQGKEVTQERLELEKAACSQVLIATPPHPAPESCVPSAGAASRALSAVGGGDTQVLEGNTGLEACVETDTAAVGPGW